MKALLLVCSLLAVPTGAALAADSPWNGTWTLDPGKSHLTGETIMYSKGPGNLSTRGLISMTNSPSGAVQFTPCRRSPR
jgi:hypothetical protein